MEWASCSLDMSHDSKKQVQICRDKKKAGHSPYISSMNFLIDGDAFLIFCSASLARVLVASEGGRPSSWVVHTSWPVITFSGP